MIFLLGKDMYKAFGDISLHKKHSINLSEIDKEEEWNMSLVDGLDLKYTPNEINFRDEEINEIVQFIST